MILAVFIFSNCLNLVNKNSWSKLLCWKINLLLFQCISCLIRWNLLSHANQGRSSSGTAWKENKYVNISLFSYVKTVLIKRIDWKNSLSKQLKDFNNSSKRPAYKIFLTSQTMAWHFSPTGVITIDRNQKKSTKLT